MVQQLRSTVVLSLTLVAILWNNTTAAGAQQPREFAVEVFQVFELPLTVTRAALVKTKGGYQLKCSIANSSESRQLGLRYSLAVIDSNMKSSFISRNEGIRVDAYQTKSVNFKTTLKLKLNGNERLVLMPEQVISTHYVWDVLKAKEALTAYIAGDYSVTPRVLRVSNHVDAPIAPRVIYLRP